jgi:hypothetical protein
MPKDRNQTESENKGEESEGTGRTAMERFRSLARRLVRVPHSELEAERQRQRKTERSDES